MPGRRLSGTVRSAMRNLSFILKIPVGRPRARSEGQCPVAGKPTYQDLAPIIRELSVGRTCMNQHFRLDLGSQIALHLASYKTRLGVRPTEV